MTTPSPDEMVPGYTGTSQDAAEMWMSLHALALELPEEVWTDHRNKVRAAMLNAHTRAGLAEDEERRVRTLLRAAEQREAELRASLERLKARCEHLENVALSVGRWSQRSLRAEHPDDAYARGYNQARLDVAVMVGLNHPDGYEAEALSEGTDE